MINRKSKEWYGFKITAKYSLVDEYLLELKNEGYEFGHYQGDFLPLIDNVDPLNKNPHSLDYWTGYYSNQPEFK